MDSALLIYALGSGLLLAACLVLSKARNASSDHERAVRTKLTSWTVVAIGVTLVLGWQATCTLGQRARTDIQREADTQARALSDSLAAKLSETANAAAAMAAAPEVGLALRTGSSRDIRHADPTLDRFRKAFHLSVCYILNAHGKTVGATNRNTPESFVGKDYSFRPYFRDALTGKRGRYYAVGVTSRKRGFYASSPVRDANDRIIGAAVMKRDMEDTEFGFRPHSYAFLTDPHGVIFLSSHKDSRLSSLWPLSGGDQSTILASKQFGIEPFTSVLSSRPEAGDQVSYRGESFLFQRMPLGSQGGWSVVLMTSARPIITVRLLTVIVTILVSVLIMAASMIAQGREGSRARLQSSEQRYRDLVECSPNCIILLSVEGECLSVNESGLQVLGLAETEAAGKSFALLWPEESRAAVNEAMAHVSQGSQMDFDASYVRPDGKTLFLHTVLRAATDEDGNVAKIIGVSMDITVRKRTEQELNRALRAAEDASKAKSDFLANMSHEIRTPMNGIIGMTELVLDTELSREQRDYLDTVKMSADSLLGVISDILDFSKIEARQLDLDSIDFDLRDNVGDTLQTLALRAHTKGLELLCRIEPDVPDSLIGDQLRLRQVLINLIGNAIKFTHEGEILVCVECEKKSRHKAVLHFSVSDTGIGIPADKQEMIFRDFTQADSSVTRRYGGTGLGLAISSRIVALMGGRIWVESEPDKGSTFHFTAELETRTASRKPDDAMEQVDLRNLRVLVVDDNATNRRILEQVLINWQMKPTLVDGGQAALEVLDEAAREGNRFAVVLLDSQMPSMDGLAVARQMKLNPKLKGTKIAMLTSAGRPEDFVSIREAGIGAYLVKPVRQSDLLDRLITLVCSRSRNDNVSEAPPVAKTEPAFGALKILLAEDNAVNQKLAVRLLEKRGHSVVVAGDGRAAIEALKREEFDLILMDVQMPVMDGLEATALIRENEKSTGTHVPIVAMTAHAMKGDSERCIDAGMDAYLSKPIRIDELTQTIEAIGKKAFPQQEAA